MKQYDYHFREHWTIPAATPDEVWDVMADGRLLPAWWRGVCLASTALTPHAAGPMLGERVRVRMRGFLPYRFDVIFEATGLERGRVIEMTASGDFEGVWQATLSPSQAGTQIAIDWRVTVTKPLMRVLGPVLRPLLIRNHNWTSPRGEAGLQAYLADHSGGTKL